MPHINDPLLQAYVDGVCNDARVREIEEHLAACASCRERFEQVRGAATRASELLAALDPGPVHAPAFEELQARAAARAAGNATSQGSAAERVPAATSSTATDSGRGAAGAGPGQPASGAPELDLSVFATPKKRGRASLWRSPALAWAATVVIAFLLGWLSRTEIIVPGATPAGSLDGFARAPSPAPAEPAAQAPVAGAELDDAVAKSTVSGDPADEAVAGMASEAGAQGAAGTPDERREMEQSLGRQAGEEAQRRVAATSPTGADLAAAGPTANAAAAADPRARAADAVAEPAAPQPLAPAEEVAQAGAAPLIAEGNEGFADAAMPIASSTAPGFVTIHRDAVAAFLGAQPRTLSGMALLRAEVAAGGQVPGGLADRFAVRMIYQAPTGQEIALLQQYVGIREGQESGAPGANAPERAAANAGARPERPAAAGDYVFRADRDMAGALEAAIDALDLPATSRDPDGRVTHRWRDSDFVLAISAMLDADVVRGLADQVR